MKTAPSPAVQNSKSPAAVAPKTSTGEEEAEEDNEEDAGQEYDPHFEPIIPLPDTIEVRTGEEEEEKGGYIITVQYGPSFIIRIISYLFSVH